MNEPIDYLHEVFDVFGPIRARRIDWHLTQLYAQRSKS
jgi:hypothetical protein